MSMSKNRETIISQIKKLQKVGKNINNKIQSLKKERTEINNKILDLCPHDEMYRVPNGDFHSPGWCYICNICYDYIKKQNINFDKIKLVKSYE